MPAHWLFASSFAISALIGLVLIPRIVLATKKIRLFDKVNDRSVHSKAVPRLGGIAFYPAVTIASITTMSAVCFYRPELLYANVDHAFGAGIMLFGVGMILLFITGLYDDIIGVGYRYKFLVQLLSALMIALPMDGYADMFGFIGLWGVSPVVYTIFTVVAAVFLINAYNLIDGVDGLCSGISALSVAAFAYLFGRRGDIVVPTLAAGCIGVLLVFMRYNVFGKRMKIFMGDTGSMFLGYIVAFMALNYISSTGMIIRFDRSSDVFAVAFGAVFIPAFDALRLFVIRLSRGKSPFVADNNHIHHKFLSLGFSHLASTLSIMFLHAFIIVLNIILVQRFSGIATWIVFGDIVFGMGMILTLNLLIRSRKATSAVRVPPAA